MSVESTLFDALKTLVSNRVYPDIAPENATRPYITYQQVGGLPVNFVDTATVPSKRNSRFQINVWADTRAAAATLAGQVETALRGAAPHTTVLGAPVALFDLETRLRGTRQDFSFWS